MNRTIVKLQGGLGNQMFQYASARGFIIDQQVSFDLSFLANNNRSTEVFTARTYELGIFENLKLVSLNQLLIRAALTERKNLLKLKMFLPAYLKNIQKINDSNYTSNLVSNSNYYLDGYFQNPTNFSNIRANLLDEFKFPTTNYHNEILKKNIKDGNSVSIHVRRGDYLKQSIISHHGVLPFEYYANATSIIESKILNPVFYVFSDDIDWCMTNFKKLKCEFIFINSLETLPWFDMFLMTCCKNNIIANSSYSWWGAWLNKNDHKMVIAPKKWFVAADSKIVPEEWIRL